MTLKQENTGILPLELVEKRPVKPSRRGFLFGPKGGVKLKLVEVNHC